MVTPSTTASRLWAGTILQWAAHASHWRINIILYEGNMRASLCTLAAGYTSYQRIASCAGTRFRTQTQESQATRYYAECPNHSAMTHHHTTKTYIVHLCHSPQSVTLYYKNEQDTYVCVCVYMYVDKFLCFVIFTICHNLTTCYRLNILV